MKDEESRSRLPPLPALWGGFFSAFFFVFVSKLKTKRERERV